MTLGKLKLLLLAFFAALATPTAILVYQAYGQLKWEAFHQHQQLAREISLRIDTRFQELLRREQSRPFSEYSFFKISGEGSAAFLQRSPLSDLLAEDETPGLLGHFQVDNRGQLQTPMLPQSGVKDYLSDSDELRRRVDQQQVIQGILSENRLVKKEQAKPEEISTFAGQAEEAMMESTASAPIEEIVPQAQEEEPALVLFDSLSNRGKRSISKLDSPAGRVEDFELQDRYDSAVQSFRAAEPEKKAKTVERKSRTEKTLLPETSSIVIQSRDAGDADSADTVLPRQQAIRIRAFESEVEPLEFSLLDSGHFVLFRRVWHDGERYVQGLLFDQAQFIDGLVSTPFYQSSLSGVSDLILSHRGDVLQLINARTVSDYSSSRIKGSELLYQTRLVAPFSELELIFSLSHLPLATGNRIVIWSAVVLTLVLMAGTWLLYRLGARQIDLARQQQDFVSAVSHELKTPLTSIRMYGEMLREGWADESRKKSYYDFIFFESERLSRLINNVLQLARMTRRDEKAVISELKVDRLLEEVIPRIESQLQQAGFQLQVNCNPQCRDATIRADSDWFTQIIINLVDNAIKFSAAAEIKTVHLTCLRESRYIVFSVRDYGPGIDKDQIKMIFKLFYRSENELTRETLGTGIGLALVKQLAAAMNAEVDVINREPGAEFRVCFPCD